MKFFMAFVVASFVVVFHFRTISSSKFIIPRMFEDFGSVKDLNDHVNYILTRRFDSEKRSVDSTEKCVAPDSSNINITVTNKRIDPSWDNRPICSLVEVPVKINTRLHSNPFPSYIRLHRCMGSSEWFPTLKHCTVKRKEEITVNYLDVGTNYQEVVATKMYNHTECEEDCIIKEHHCDPKREIYRSCHCQCAIDSSYCDSSYQTFDISQCKCTCKNVKKCDAFEEWNTTTCTCQCAKKMREMCEMANYAIDESTCTCVPLINSPPPITSSPPPSSTSPPPSSTSPPPSTTSPPPSTTSSPTTTGFSNNINAI